MRSRAFVKRHRERRTQGGLISKLAGFAPFSIFLWLLFGLYWILNILMIVIMPYCNYDLF
ncbi:hypothetical protein FF098_010020 [Parvularcula flava]|uniref:Uncharacterized protein n=1 Tax=Aquisalinus luteolus TaxID=1566827 RepID=A0A8J3ER98_9PROT|nr:hypothetical protein [Aquisalinus luteolus]NHK28240.1 hypothetical protein [Aquisalinus luteolus]GGH97885.1 hypothetical protein GCM10011355_20170 [Aquisalinus luteolus]